MVKKNTKMYFNQLIREWDKVDRRQIKRALLRDLGFSSSEINKIEKI
tara:strand:- start:462 stop:602 length:141 start_codon:yes stop_codon:yes gene_type:complete